MEKINIKIIINFIIYFVILIKFFFIEIFLI
jgi:hypothetical protein